MSRRKLIVILILASLAIAVAVPAGASADRVVKGPGYKTYVPSGWTIQRQRTNGWNITMATPRGSRRLSVRIGTIGVISLRKQIRKLQGKALPSSPVELVQTIAPIPPVASNLQVVVNPQATKLGGILAGFLAVHFDQPVIGGTGMSLTALQRGNRVYLVDAEGGDDLGLLGSPAASTVVNRWRWT